MDFLKFKSAVAAQFAKMGKGELFRTSIEKDTVWEMYLASFPEGTNPIFRERTVHDCSCCKQFIRNVGNVVSVVDGELVSVWDITVGDPVYQQIANILAAAIRTSKIENKFLTTEKTAGTDRNFEDILGNVKTWDHFFVNIPKQFVVPGADIGPKLGENQALHDVLLRSLDEITDEAIETVLELIGQNSLYRGEEHKFAVTEFKKLKKLVKTNRISRDVFVWTNIATIPVSVAKIRNTAIGTLLTDLSEGYDLDDAVKSFEAKVAPTNYRRPTALVTKSMIEGAKKKIEELGLTSALERRYATLEDININDILFADREAKRIIEPDVFDSIPTKTSTKTLDKVEEVSIDKFLSDIVPNVDSIEVFVENKHSGNLVSLVAPVDPSAGHLFKWGNNFSWSYNGDVADSIKERVKKAGGNVVGDLCCRLAWFNHDDLDFHMVEPGGFQIYFGSRYQLSPGGGQLDVDMNAGSGTTRTPVENIVYPSKAKMKEGIYKLFVHNYSKRETTGEGFEAEIDFMGTVYRFAVDRQIKSSEKVIVAEFSYSKKDGLVMSKSLPSTQASKILWNVATSEFHKVSVLMKSPNHWDGERGIGNKHYFFMLDKCANDDKARGFYNEFLDDALTPHRKVIEIVGSKMKTEESENQLSGLGFSSTQHTEVLVRVKGNFTRTIKVML